MRYNSFLAKEDSLWGEQQVARFRWVLIAAIIVLIGYVYALGHVHRAMVSLSLAVFYILYNAIIFVLIKRYKQAGWIRYVSSFIDVTILSLHIFNYSFFFTPLAVATAPSLFLYPILIMLSVLRYDGKLVIFTTLYVILCSNVIYFMRYADFDPIIMEHVASSGPQGAIYRSVYFLLMGYFMFSIPKMINRLVERQNNVGQERREIEIKLALETQRRELAIQKLMMEKRLSEQLNQQKKVIEKQKNNLEKAVSTRDKLFSIIGHDLRSPFCVQSSLSEYLIHDIKEVEEVKLMDTLKAIHRSSNNGLDLLSNLMDWSKAQSDMLEPHPELINVSESISIALDRQVEVSNNKKIQVISKVSKDAVVFTDKQMMVTLLRNLLSNAIKFTNEKGLIEIEGIQSEDYFELSIIDNGVGMEDDKLDSLFSLDKQVTSLGTKNEKGTGLGLILCKELVELNMGTITAESILGKGTRIIVALPKSEQDAINKFVNKINHSVKYY